MIMESSSGMNSGPSGVTVIAPEAPSSYHVAPRNDGNSSLVPGASHLGPSPVNAGGIIGSSEKKKRGRPRKYGPDGAVARALSPTPASSSAPPAPGGSFLAEKMGAPRPASEKKQRSKIGAENLGDWISCTTGGNFLPHLITVDAGQDVTMKIISFSQQGPRAICIISANGLISNVTLRQPNSSGGTLTYEGRFEILSLSGSFTPTEFGGSRTSRTGGMSISLASPDGRVVGGMLAGLLIAASPVQVIVGSFLPSNYNEFKTPKKPKAEPKPIPNSQVSVAMPHNPNTDTRNPGALAMVYPGSGTQSAVPPSNNWGAMATVDDSRKAATDINISLQGE
nr:AT-hook motif nuclear-localized protein 1-like [Ipomoea batatas]